MNDANGFELMPAIDLLDGECVRLVKGKPQAKTSYDSNPVSVALKFIAEGAKTLHVIDLNAALASGSGSNADAIKAIVKAIRGKAKIQVGGGIRDATRAKQLFSIGVKRVIIGTAAFTPELEKITRCGETLAAIDYANGEIQVNGWTKRGTKLTKRAITELENTSITGFLATDVERDGTLKGTRTATLKKIVDAATLPVYAAGGVARLDDVRAAASAGAAGVVVGKALYEKKFTLEQAIDVAKATGVAAQC